MKTKQASMSTRAWKSKTRLTLKFPSQGPLWPWRIPASHPRSMSIKSWLLDIACIMFYNSWPPFPSVSQVHSYLLFNYPPCPSVLGEPQPFLLDTHREGDKIKNMDTEETQEKMRRVTGCRNIRLKGGRRMHSISLPSLLLSSGIAC